MTSGISASKAKTPKIGATCNKLGDTKKTSVGDLKCKSVGKKRVWQADSKRKSGGNTKSHGTSSPKPGSSGSTAKGTDTNSDQLSSQCASLLVSATVAYVSRTPSGGDFSTVLSQMANCQKDTGNTEIITAAPFNLADIQSITKFRSCVGHDFAEGSQDGKVTTSNPIYEKFSSMKHYVKPIKQSAGDHTEVFAPFDGLVTGVVADTGSTSGGGAYANPGSQIHIIASANPAYTFLFMHIYGITVKAGDMVQASQLLGYHEVQASNVGHSSFDAAMSKFDEAAMQSQATIRASMMTLLSPKLAASFATAGVTKENLIWSRAYRDSNPCPMGANGFFTGAQNPIDSVVLRH